MRGVYFLGKGLLHQLRLSVLGASRKHFAMGNLKKLDESGLFSGKMDAT
jgi:hypothetical protein